MRSRQIKSDILKQKVQTSEAFLNPEDTSLHFLLCRKILSNNIYPTYVNVLYITKEHNLRSLIDSLKVHLLKLRITLGVAAVCVCVCVWTT